MARIKLEFWISRFHAAPLAPKILEMKMLLKRLTFIKDFTIPYYTIEAITGKASFLYTTACHYSFARASQMKHLEDSSLAKDCLFSNWGKFVRQFILKQDCLIIQRKIFQVAIYTVHCVFIVRKCGIWGCTLFV